MDAGIQLLDIAPGIKELLEKAGFTVDSIVSEGAVAVSTCLRIETYVAKLIYDEAKRIAAETAVVVAP